MKKLFGISLLLTCLLGCDKEKIVQASCDIQKTYSDNAEKVTITSGIWGTVSSMEGDCMPMVPPSTSSCKTCPVKRTVKIYEYTTPDQATPYNNSTTFFDSFSTQIVAEIDTDDDGFYQANIPAGHYTIVILENGKLYANGRDGQGGLSPVIYSGEIQKVNLTMTYKAVF